MSKLNFYIALLGGKHAKANVEVHDVIPAIAANIQDAFTYFQAQWFGLQQGLHLDSWMQVEGVHYHGVNYQIQIQNQPTANRDLNLYLINLGAYIPDQFGEVHKYLVVAGHDKADAKAQGKLAIEQHWFKPHTDAVIEVDDCLALNQVGQYFIHLVEGEFAETQFKNDYIILK